RQRQSEHQAARLLAGQPARLLSGHQGGAAFWADQQPVQQEIRAVRNLFRPAIRRECGAAARLDGSSHGSAGAAAGRLWWYTSDILSEWYTYGTHLPHFGLVPRER